MKSFMPLIRYTLVLIIIMIFAVAIPMSAALAYSDGPRNPQAGSNLEGVGTEVWQNPGNITDPTDLNNATVVLYNKHTVTNYLVGSSYGFTIPVDAKIDGIEVTIDRYVSLRNPSITDNEVRLVKAGAVVGDNKALADPWPTTFAAITYGGPTDLWGTTWARDEVNDPGFGAALSAIRDNNGNNDRTANVRSITITVYYSYSTTTEVACETPITYGDSVTCVATVTRVAGTETPSGNVNWTTNGTGNFSPNPCALSGSTGVATCTATYTPTQVGTGTHAVIATYTGDAFFGTSSGSQDVAVDRLAVTVTADAVGKVYRQVDPPLTYTYAPELVFGDTFTGILEREVGEVAGSYAILQGTLALTDNYILTYEGNPFTISKADVACTVTGYDVIFDGTAYFATGECLGVLGEVLDGLDLSGTEHTNAGSYTDPWTFTDMTGNYNDAAGSVDDNINKAEATCTVTGYNVTYDGDPHFATGACLGVMGEVLDGLDLSGTEHTEAGIYIADSWAFNDMSGNYNDTAGSVDDNISKADATCLVEGYNVVYDGEPHSAPGTCTGVKGEELPMLDLAATEHTDVGSYSDYWVFTDETGNYNDTAGFVDDVINQADASCTIYSYDVVFDGQSHFATGECLGMMGEVLEGLDFSATEHAVPGEYQDIWTFTETNGNYAYQSGFVYDTIHKADPTCEVNGYNVEYDGEAHSAGGSCTGVWDEPLAGLDLSNTVHTAVGSYEDSWTYTDQTGLYNDISNVVNDEITLREITVTADAQTKVYGQSDPELTYQVTVGSLLTSDEFSGGLTRVSGENVGSYAILQGTLSLPDYYHLNFVGATLTITGHVIWIPIIRR